MHRYFTKLTGPTHTSIRWLLGLMCLTTLISCVPPSITLISPLDGAAQVKPDDEIVFSVSYDAAGGLTLNMDLAAVGSEPEHVLVDGKVTEGYSVVNDCATDEYVQAGGTCTFHVTRNEGLKLGVNVVTIAVESRYGRDTATSQFTVEEQAPPAPVNE